jgi:hypothetical protein
MSARAPRESARKRPEKALQYRLNALNIGEAALRVSLNELLNLNSGWRGVLQTTLRVLREIWVNVIVCDNS